MPKKEKSVAHYNSRVWLNPEDSRSTGSVVCYKGRYKYRDNEDEEMFVEIADCNNKVKLHKTFCDTKKDFIAKLELLQSELQNFIEFLKTEK